MRALLTLVIGVCCLVACQQVTTTEDSAPSGPFLGETPPAMEPALFAEGIVSSHLNQRDTAWTTDGDQLFYSIWARNRGVIVTVRRIADHWSAPEIAPFSGHYSDLEPFISADGERLYFISKRPLDPGGEEKDWDIWVVRHGADGWNEPENLGPPINTDRNEFYPSLTRDGTLYFTGADRDDSFGGEDLYLARPVDGGFSAPENLGPAINSPGPEYNAMVSPGEDYIIFGSAREGDLGGGDLYISFRRDDGSWSQATNMGPPINSSALDFCPALSPDGRFLFFTSSRVAAEASVPSNYQELVASLSGPLNGSMNLYWIAAGAIERIRP
jgi:Tol biopolymer transport system component